MTKRLNRSATMRELIEKDGKALMGDPKAICPNCGKGPKPFQVITPRLGWNLTAWIPCTCKARN